MVAPGRAFLRYQSLFAALGLSSRLYPYPGQIPQAPTSLHGSISGGGRAEGISHSTVSADCTCTNGAQSSVSRMRRAEKSVTATSQASTGAATSRRAHGERLTCADNGAQVRGAVGLALAYKPSVDFCGYWQRSAAIMPAMVPIPVSSRASSASKISLRSSLHQPPATHLTECMKAPGLSPPLW